MGPSCADRSLAKSFSLGAFVLAVGVSCGCLNLLTPRLQDRSLLYEDWDTTAAVPDDMRGWSFFVPPGSERYESQGGNTGGHIRAFVSSFIPFFGTTDGLQKGYVGNKDYQALGIAGIRFDLNIFDNTLLATARQIAVILVSDAGTPNASFDDTSVVYVSDTIIPQPGSGWQTYSFEIPSQSTTLPQGWKILGLSGDWQTVIRDVDKIEITFGDPSLVFLIDDMTVGVDNVEIYPFVD